MTEKVNPNDDVKLVVNEKDGCKVELEITLPPALTEKARKEAIKTISKEIKIPGFRPGKAPEDRILKDYKTQVDAEWNKALGDIGFKALSKKEAPNPLSRETKIIFDVKKLDPENDTIVTYTYEVEPKIPSVDIEKFKLKDVTPIVIDKEKVSEAIRQMQFFYAKWKDVTDRPIQENDYIIVDIDSIEDDKPVNVFSGTRFEVTEKGMANWMKKLVVGLKTDESAEGISEADDHLSEKEKAEFAPKKVRVTIKKIEDASLPELDDEFAKKVGSESIKELQDSVKNMLQTRADDQVLGQKKEQVNRYLLSEAKFAVPPTQLQEEVQHRLKDLHQVPQFQEQWSKSSDEEKKKIQAQIFSEAEESIRLFYIARQVVREKNVQITEDEWKNEAMGTLKAQAVPGSMPDPSKISPEVMALALSKIILAKAQGFILETNQPIEKPAEKSEEGKNEEVKKVAKKKAPKKETETKKSSEKKETPEKKAPKKKKEASEDK